MLCIFIKESHAFMMAQLLDRLVEISPSGESQDDRIEKDSVSTAGLQLSQVSPSS